MPTPWIKFGSYTLCLEQLPGLLERGGLLVPLIRRVLIETATCEIEVTPEEQTAFHRQFLISQGISSREQLDDWLLQKRLTEEQASQNVLDTLRLERFKVMSFEPKVDQVFFETKDARDRVVYSLLRVRDEASASELFLRLDEGDATFTDLSNEHSMGPERDSGGLIGPVVLGQLHPKLSEIFRIANIDQLWGPLQIDDWWVVLRLDKKLPAVLDDKMRKLIINELFESWINERVDQFLLSYASSASDSSGA